LRVANDAEKGFYPLFRYLCYCPINTLCQLPAFALNSLEPQLLARLTFPNSSFIHIPLSTVARDIYEAVVLYVCTRASLDVFEEFYLDHAAEHDDETVFQLSLLCNREDISQFLLQRGKIDVRTQQATSESSLTRERITMTFNIAQMLVRRWEITNSTKDLVDSHNIFHGIRHSKFASPKLRIRAAVYDGDVLWELQEYGRASNVLEEAVALLPRLRPLGRDDLQHTMSHLSGIGPNAASMALETGRSAYDSLRLLELGRAVIMGFSLDYRSELSDLRAVHPNEAAEFEIVRRKIDSTAHSTGKSDEESERHRQAAIDFEEKLASICQLSSCSQVLQPPSADDLMKIAAEGPIVIFNSTKIRGDAIIVTHSEIKALPLPELRYEVIDIRFTLPLTGIPRVLRQYLNARVRLTKFLEWLWDVAVGPVLEYLQLDNTLSNNQTRIWWIGTGKLSSAPFHAAGVHYPGSTRNTFDRVISSYVPTIRALSYARQEDLRLFEECRREIPQLLLVNSHDTAAHDIVETIDSTRVSSSVLVNPRASTVLEAIQSYKLVHLPCTGISDTDDPSNSHFLFSNTESDQPEIFSVRDIARIHIDGAQLAYLLADTSALVKPNNLADEVINMASAFQLAGFSHVLAYLFRDHRHVTYRFVDATDFYKLLFNGEGRDTGHRRVAWAHHNAIRKLQEIRRHPIYWAGYIHIGA